MNSKIIWTDQIPDKDGVKNPINDISISPDGSRVIIGVGNRVLLYDGNSGDLIESLRGHKDTVNSVDFSTDGSRFASGGSDNVVVIWKSSGQGLLRYNHTAPIQRVKYNPTSLQLASCSDIDFGLWNPEQKQVSKEKVGSKILSVAWSPDGLTLAIGMQSGVISLRNQQGEETYRMERRAPIFCMVFIPGVGGMGGSKTAAGAGASPTPGGSMDGDVLAVGCWDKTLSMYRLQGSSHRLVGERNLRYYPCSLALAGANGSKSNNLIISGSNKKVMLYSRDGMRLAEIAKKSSWVWGIACSQTNSAAANFSSDFDRVVLGSDAGGIDAIQLLFESVHSLYRDRYAYRENLTEIIVHNLLSDKKVRIKCKDLIKNISMYKNKLAVQLTDRVCIYESSAEEALDMHFRLRKERISIGTPHEKNGKEPVNEDKATAMVVTSNNLLFCRENMLEIYGLDGQRLRVWKLDSPVTCMKVDGGPEGREGIVLGMESGSVVKVFVDNPFPIELYKAPLPPSSGPSNASTTPGQEGESLPGAVTVTCIDMSLYRTFLALVTSSNVLLVVDMKTQETLFTKTGVSSVCFNSEVNNMLCYTTSSSFLSSSDSSMFVVSGIGLKKSADGAYSSHSKAGSQSQYAPPLEQLQHMSGPAIGFQAQKIYSLHRGVIMGVDVPHSENMRRALDVGDIKSAYSVACLGATEADWKVLAVNALRANCLDISKICFARLKDTKYLSLIESMERGETHSTTAPENVQKPVPSVLSSVSSASGDKKGTGRVRGVEAVPVPVAVVQGQPFRAQTLDPIWQAELLAYEGHHQEAAKTFSRAGKVDEAIRMLTDLRRWEDAKLFAQNAGQSDHSGLTMRQAKWLQEINDWKGAAELYVSMGQRMQAAKIISESGEMGWQIAMIEVVRSCPIEEKETLLYCGEVFNKENEDTFTKETYIKTGNISLLMNLYGRRQMWTEAAKLADENVGKFDVSVFLPYAEFLVSQDLYEDAMVAYRKAGRSDLAKKVLEELTYNAVSESRFKDAAYHYWLLSKEGEDSIAPSVTPEVPVPEHMKGTPTLAQQQASFEQKADLYFAYANVHAYITDPFTSFQPEMLFQVSRYILNALGSAETIPFGISKAATLYTLARQAMPLGAFKLARHVYDRLSMLQTVHLSKIKKQDEIELDMLIVQAKPVRDDPDILPVCYRCSSTNPLLNPFTNKFAKGDVCTNCGHPFVRSFVNFDILPLVEFIPDPRISDEEAIDLIRQEGNRLKGGRGGKGKGSGWKEGKEGESDMMTLDDDEGPRRGAGYDDYQGSSFGGGDDQDMFTRCVNSTLENQRTVYIPATLDAATLVSLKRAEVFVCRGTSKGKRATFYRNMLPEIPIAISPPCNRFFHLEDFEFAYLSSKNCPYSRLKNVGEYGSL